MLVLILALDKSDGLEMSVLNLPVLKQAPVLTVYDV